MLRIKARKTSRETGTARPLGNHKCKRRAGSMRNTFWTIRGSVFSGWLTYPRYAIEHAEGAIDRVDATGLERLLKMGLGRPVGERFTSRGFCQAFTLGVIVLSSGSLIYSEAWRHLGDQ